MEHDPKELQAVMEAAGPLNLEPGFRPMFGGTFGYAAGQAFASLSNVGQMSHCLMPLAASLMDATPTAGVVA